MKVESSQTKKITTDPPKKMSKEEIQAKLQAKFGKSAAPKKSKEPNSVELHSKKGVNSSNDDDFGDVGKNNPKSEVTHEKLKSILKKGAFNFNPKEREALSKILK